MAGNSKSQLLQGKFAVVTGASRGIGRAIAERFAAEGASLVMTARSEKSLKEVSDAIIKVNPEAQVETYPLDMSNSPALDQFVKTILDKNGHVDVLVNNAGMMSGAHPLEGDPSTWEKMIALNVLAPMRMTHHVGNAMAERGSGTIINIDSVAGIDAIASQAAYAASKHAITGWTESVAQIMKGKGVKVTAIMPAVVKSIMTEDMGLDEEAMILPEDIAEAAMLPFRFSDNATPTSIVVRNAKVVQK